MNDIKQLIANLPQQGRLEWIGLRPDRRVTMHVVQRAELITNHGLGGDRSARTTGGKRQVTLIQSEHLQVIASCLGKDVVAPELLRRNLVIRGINLLALKDKTFSIGGTLLEYSGLCAPCSYMEEVLGEGGYNAMRGHGGITARVLRGGTIALGDSVAAIVNDSLADTQASDMPGTV